MPDLTSATWLVTDIALCFVMFSASITFIRMGLIASEFVYLITAIFLAGLYSPGMMAVASTAVFAIIINVIMVVRYYRERSLKLLSEDELVMYQKLFSILSPYEFKTLLKDCSMETCSGVLLKKGDPFTKLYFLHEGEVLVHLPGHSVKVDQFNFFGEMSYLEEGKVPISADVEVIGEAKMLVVTEDDLLKLDKRFEGFKSRFKHVLALNVVNKLRSMNDMKNS